MNKTTETIDAETGEVMPATNLPARHENAPSSAVHNLVQPPPPVTMPVTGFAKLAEAIAAVTHEIGQDPIKKEGRNKFHNYSYARMQDILGGLTPLMSKHGVVIMQTEVQRGLLDNGNVIFATYDFTIMHKSGEVWPFPQRQTGTSKVRDSKGGYDDKGLNKCHTSARKYFLMSLFQIPTTDDEDADQGGDNGYGRGRPVQKKGAAERGYDDDGKGSMPPSDEDRGPPPEKVKPHEIPRPQGISPAVWGGKFIEQILLCDTTQEIDSWSTANEKSLNDLEGFAPKIHANVMKAVDNRVKWINTPAPQQ
jgi:hypothetical protein